MWTRFFDMCSGGGQKEEWGYIYIEAPMKEAEVIFYNRFGHNPNCVTCTCCGEDYAIDQYETLDEATKFDEGDRGALVIKGEDITSKERVGDVPDEGYMWV